MKKESKSIIEDLNLLTPQYGEFIANYPKTASMPFMKMLGVDIDPNAPRPEPTIYKKEDFKFGEMTATELESIGFGFHSLLNSFRYKDIEIYPSGIEYIDEYYSQTLNITTITELKQFIKMWYGE